MRSLLIGCGSKHTRIDDKEWGDPGHTRLITIGTLSFLSQKGYKDKDDFKRTDYRQYYKADFNVAQYVETDNHLLFVLEVVK